MKAEERKHLEENELQHWLADAWASVTSGSTVNTVIWGLIVLGLVLFIGYRHYSRTAAETRSMAWAAFDRASSADDLDKIAKEYPDTVTARMARFNLSRLQMQDAMTRVAGPNRDDKAKAASTLEDVRKRYLELAKESGDEPALVQEAYTNAAKIEETLCGVPKADDVTKPRGSLDEAIKLYDELAKKYPKSWLGEQAAKRSKEISDRRAAFDAFYLGILKQIAPPPTPDMPIPATPIIPTPEAPKPDAKAPEAPKPEVKTPDLPKSEGKTPEPPKPDAKAPDAPKPDEARPKN